MSAGARVRAQYTGRVLRAPGQQDAALLEGTVFDSSRERPDPFAFELGAGHVISGWDKGFAAMRVGERALLIIAPSYAYGEQAGMPKIPPGATLEFDVELLGYDGEGAEGERKEEL